jgi:hypothetical protein
MKISVRHVKFSPEEMAYDAPEDTSDWGPSCRGLAAWRAYRRQQRVLAKLEPDVRKAFPDDASVNDALRSLMRGGNGHARRRKSA